MSEKDWHNTLLLDFYGEFLSGSQREIMTLYYDEDLTQSEISEQIGITRQGVRDAILRSEETLRDFEARLHLAERYRSTQKQLSQLRETAAELLRISKTSGMDEIVELAERLTAQISELSQ